MLITPRPGVNRDNLLKTLRTVHEDVANLYTSGPHTAYKRLLAYLEWANDAVRHLARQISDADLNRLVLTPRYAALLDGMGLMAGTEQQRLVNGLVSLELEQRVRDFEEAVDALAAHIEHWSGPKSFIVADSSFYIQHPQKLDNADFGALLPVDHEAVHLLVPIVVLDELDKLKESKDRHTRWRAGATLAVVDRLLTGESTTALLLRAPVDGEPADNPPKIIHVELMPDPVGHVRLPIADDEIVDRAYSAQQLAGRPVTLITYDTSQATRGRIAGLRVNKLRHDAGTGPEPARS